MKYVHDFLGLLGSFGDYQVPQINKPSHRKAESLGHSCSLHAIERRLFVSDTDVEDLPESVKMLIGGRSDSRQTSVDEMRQALDQLVPSVGISRDSHYQLANRVAYAWKLASLGIPNVLVYLGFIGDVGIDDVGPHFESEDRWQRVFESYTSPVLPYVFVGQALACGPATMQLIVRWRDVIEHSKGR